MAAKVGLTADSVEPNDTAAMYIQASVSKYTQAYTRFTLRAIGRGAVMPHWPITGQTFPPSFNFHFILAQKFPSPLYHVVPENFAEMRAFVG